MSATTSCQCRIRAVHVAVQILVISQHEDVRQQLVNYLSRSPSLAVTGTAFGPEAIIKADPDVLVLDLSQLDHADLRTAIDAAKQIGARFIALASLVDTVAEELVVQAGGLYQLKVAGASGLTELVRAAMDRPSPADGDAFTV